MTTRSTFAVLLPLFLLLPHAAPCLRLRIDTPHCLQATYSLFHESSDRPAYRSLGFHRKRPIYIYFLRGAASSVTDAQWLVGPQFGGEKSSALAFVESWALSPLLLHPANWTWRSSIHDAWWMDSEVNVVCEARPLSLHLQSVLYPAVSGFYTPVGRWVGR